MTMLTVDQTRDTLQCCMTMLTVDQTSDILFSMKAVSADAKISNIYQNVKSPFQGEPAEGHFKLDWCPLETDV